MAKVFTPQPSLKFYDAASCRWMLYVYPASAHASAGWICYQHPSTGEWVSLRKATDSDIAELNRAVVGQHHREDAR
jgi:hypothetical protein